MVTLCESLFQALTCICLDEIESIYDPDTRGKLRYREIEGAHFSTTLSCSDLNSAPRVLKPGQCHFFNGKRQQHNSFFFPFVHHHYNLVSKHSDYTSRLAASKYIHIDYTVLITLQYIESYFKCSWGTYFEESICEYFMN